MNKIELTDTHEGWIVQVYGRDRRLLCVLEPSHLWAFVVGCGLGVVLTLLFSNLLCYSPLVEPMDSTGPAKAPSLQVD